MNRLKKILPFCIIVICFACVLIWYHSLDEYELSQDVDNIEKIEIVFIPDHSIIDEGSFDQIKLITIIPEDEKEIFIDTFYDMHSTKYFGHPENALAGYSIKITYSDESFELIGDSSGYYYTNADKGKYKEYYFDNDAFYSFVNESVKKTGNSTMS